MELLTLLIQPAKSRAMCFLCLTQQEITTSVHDLVEIRDEHSDFSLTLLEMMKNLFPEHENISEQACDDCTNLIITMYIIIRRNKIKTLLLNKIMMTFNGYISKDLCNMENMIIRLDGDIRTCENLSTDEDTMQRQCNVKESDNEKVNIICENQNKSTICHVCGKICNNSNALRSHLNCHKEKQCPYCMKMLKNHSHYARHVKNHTVKSRRCRRTYYSCHDCSFRSLNKQSLQAHINKVHLHIRPYVCDLCDKSFYKENNLTEHIITHENSKNELCSICGDNFVSKKTLSIHMKIHLNEKNFECTICKKKFVTSGHRLEHFKRNHSEKMEICYVCGKKYGLKKELNRHMKKVHIRTDTESTDLL